MRIRSSQRLRMCAFATSQRATLGQRLFLAPYLNRKRIARITPGERFAPEHAGGSQYVTRYKDRWTEARDYLLLAAQLLRLPPGFDF